MAQHDFKRAENILGFPRTSPANGGAHALDLVHQAADALRGIEEQAADSERRAAAAETAFRDLLVKTERRLTGASHLLEQAQKRIEVLQAKLTSCEQRTQSAETEAREAKQALALVEEAIRRRLLINNGGTDDRMPAVA